MTYLELCQQTLRGADTESPESLTQISDISEYKATVVGFVREAWRDIENLHASWGWRQREFTAALRPGVATYRWNELRPADVELKSIPLTPGFADWLSRPPDRTGEGAEWYWSGYEGGRTEVGSLEPVLFEEMRRRLLLTSTTQTRPTTFAFTPDKRIIFHPTPNEAWNVHGMYVRGVDILTTANQEPLDLPEAYHDIIKWKAVMMLQGSDEASESYAFAQQQYSALLEALERIYLPQITVGGAIA